MEQDIQHRNKNIKLCAATLDGDFLYLMTSKVPDETPIPVEAETIDDYYRIMESKMSKDALRVEIRKYSYDGVSWFETNEVVQYQVLFHETEKVVFSDIYARSDILVSVFVIETKGGYHAFIFYNMTGYRPVAEHLVDYSSHNDGNPHFALSTDGSTFVVSGGRYHSIEKIGKWPSVTKHQFESKYDSLYDSDARIYNVKSMNTGFVTSIDGGILVFDTTTNKTETLIPIEAEVLGTDETALLYLGLLNSNAVMIYDLELRHSMRVFEIPELYKIITGSLRYAYISRELVRGEDELFEKETLIVHLSKFEYTIPEQVLSTQVMRYVPERDVYDEIFINHELVVRIKANKKNYELTTYTIDYEKERIQDQVNALRESLDASSNPIGMSLKKKFQQQSDEVLLKTFQKLTGIEFKAGIYSTLNAELTKEYVEEVEEAFSKLAF